MSNFSGFWNEDGELTFEEFVGLWIMHEAGADLYQADILARVISQNLFIGGNNPASCSSSECRNGVFNFMAAYSGGNGGLFAGAANLESYFGPSGNQNMALMASYGKLALDPQSILSTDRWNGPSNWGNSSTWRDALRENSIREKQINGSYFQSVYYYKDTWIVFSINQRKEWSCMGVDTSMSKVP